MTSTGQLLTAVQTATLLNRSRRTVLRMAERGELPYVHKLPGANGAFLFDAAVVAVLARQTNNGESAQ